MRLCTMPAGVSSISSHHRSLSFYFRSTFLEAGFNADDYANELEELKKTFVPEPTKAAGQR